MGPLMAPQTVGLCNAAHKSLRNTEFCPRMEVRKLRKRSLFQKGGRSDPATNRESSGAWRLYADRDVFPDGASDYSRINTVYSSCPIRS